ncbi:MAG: hypothetical protein EZS28_023057 [Streblomastix strix]|uniref:Uncharacterized protein n=1 Tax=Streblomastix strix TaxID=222440 RepID=A0A5J4VGF6_9EUKA|nr:MAG: hypothetical protein EZS28_023057 [Streblomastix strix]
MSQKSSVVSKAEKKKAKKKKKEIVEESEEVEEEEEEDEGDEEEEEDEAEEEEEEEEEEEVKPKPKKQKSKKSKESSIKSVFDKSGTTISGTGIHIRDIQNTIVEILDVGAEKSSENGGFVKVRLRNKNSLQNAVDVTIDERNGCTIAFAPHGTPITIPQATISTSGLQTSPYYPPQPYFPIQQQQQLQQQQYIPAPGSFQFNRAKNLSAKMAELLHSQPPPQQPEPLPFRMPGYFQ